MDTKDLLKLDIVSRGKLRETRSEPDVIAISGEKCIVQVTTSRVITLTPTLWGALLENDAFKARFEALTAERMTKRAEKDALIRSTAEAYRAEGRASVAESVAIVKALGM
jgi:hypothetical protein